MTKKRQNPFLHGARLGFSHCSGELLSLEDVCREGRDMSKRGKQPISEIFPIHAVVTCENVFLTGCCPLLLQTVEVCSHSHVFCSQIDYHRVTYLSSNNFLFPHPLLPPSVAPHAQPRLCGAERAGTSTKATTPCVHHTFRAGWTFLTCLHPSF